MPTTTLRTLLTRLIDYAGLFPPASLGMAEAVANYDAERVGPHAWMLGRFIVPAARLDEFEGATSSLLPRAAGERPWRLSVLVGGDLAAARIRIDAFNRAHAQPSNGLAVIDAIETKAANEDEVAAIATHFGDVERYIELRHDADPAPLMAALARHGGAAKIRTGGVTADAFPTAHEVARFLIAAARAGVPLKATAGLHHPVRGEYRLTYAPDSPHGTMFGFLNVFVAAALAGRACQDNRAELDELAELLDERDATAFTFKDDHVSWRGHSITHRDLEAARRAAVSYGSCSFAEPVEDLQTLALLESAPANGAP